jgi:uroporphyrin-III C-methyltransferase
MSSEIPSLPPLDSTQPTASASSGWSRPSAIIAAVAVALLGWQWVETRSRLGDLQDELARRLSDSDTVGKEARALARQAQENLQDLQGKVGALESRLAESQSQQVALESMYQEFSRSRDDRVLAEVEQAVTISAQQLQLAGNVQAALFALQTADARLGSIDRPHWLPLRKAIAGDIDTLKALPQVDSAGVALKLETLIGRIDTLPLAFESGPKNATPKADKTELSLLKSLWLDFWSEFSQLVRIERMDRPDPALLAPSNAVFLRENLKLRLMNARLALLSRDGNTFREDVRISAQWLERYFDVKNTAVGSARDDLVELQKMPVGVDLPTLQGSQTALRGLQAVHERRADLAPSAPATATAEKPAKPARKN